MIPFWVPLELRHIAVSFALFILAAGCASTRELRGEMTYKEFADGIYRPVMQTMDLLSAFYAERGDVPGDQEALTAFAAKKNIPLEWERFNRFALSNDSGESTLRTGITSPSSLSETGEITTSWRLSLTPAGAKALRVNVWPESSFCLRTTSERDRTQIQRIFFDYIYWGTRGRNNCFRPADASEEREARQLVDRTLRSQIQHNPTSSGADSPSER